jgi:hypothetical protein
MLCFLLELFSIDIDVRVPVLGLYERTGCLTSGECKCGLAPVQRTRSRSESAAAD